MEWFRENRIGVFIHYINIMFMLFIARSCYNIEGFSFLYVTLLYAFLMLVYWFFTGVLHRRIYRFLIVLAAAGLAVLIWFSFQNRIIEYFYSHVVYNIENINNQLFHGSVTYFYEFKPIITLVLPVVVFLLLFFYNNRMTEGVLLLVFMEVVFFWYLDYVDDIKRLIFPFIIISVITYLMNNYKKTVHEFQKKGIYSSLNGKRLIINIVVFSMVVGIIGLTLPQEIQGKDTMSIVERFQNKYAQAQDGVGSGLENIYGLQSSGYADTESRLGGPLTLDKSVAFLVESDKPYYLKGNVKDEYTGSSWKSTVNNYQKLENGEADSLNSIMNRYSSFINEPKQIKIYPEKLRTASFLVPMYTEKISNFNGDIYMNSENSTYMSSSRISKEYTIDFYELDENRISEDYYGMYYLGNTAYQKYLQLPDTITERTVKLVYSLVKDCKDNKEKVDKIKEYLSKNYTYTLNAPAAPEGKDFVDYFLFENKRGYCVYFATALSVMCRIAGIPSRYVEGYKMSNNGTSGTKQEVTNEMAHAWIEYMAGDDIWVLADCSPTPYENEQAPTQQAVTTSDPSNPNSATSDPKTTPNVNPTGGNTGGSNNTPTIKSSGTHKVVVYSSLASAGFIALAAFLVLLIRRRRKMFHGESLVPLHSYMHKRLRRYKIIKGSTETEKEFALKQEEELRNILYPLVNKLYDEFYGGIRDKTIDKKEIYLAFERHLKKRQNKLVYYLKKCY